MLYNRNWLPNASGIAAGLATFFPGIVMTLTAWLFDALLKRLSTVQAINSSAFILPITATIPSLLLREPTVTERLKLYQVRPEAESIRTI